MTGTTVKQVEISVPITIKIFACVDIGKERKGKLVQLEGHRVQKGAHKHYILLSLV